MPCAHGPQLLSVATALPENTITAPETRSLIETVLRPADPERWLRLVDSSRIRQRHSVLPLADVLQRRSLAERTADYAREVVGLASGVGARAIEEAGVSPGDIGSIVSVSCTGYMLPSLDAHLVPRLGLDHRVRRLPVTELGCSAGVGGLSIARRLQVAEPERCVLLICVEPCSLCLRVEEPRDADLLGSVLFGDGAAAAVLGSAGSRSGPEILCDASALWPESIDLLGMELGNHGFRFILSPTLPGVVRSRVRRTVCEFLEAQGLGLDDIGFWVVHPGGPKVLDAVREALELSDDALSASWSVWERCGNVSSATVFFILREAIASAPIATGTLGIMLAFGPGVTCEIALIRSGGWMANGPTRDAAPRLEGFASIGTPAPPPT